MAESSRTSLATGDAAVAAAPPPSQQQYPHSVPQQQGEEGREGEEGKALECWICRGPSEAEDNPLIHGICRCVGSIGYVHRKCIHHWLQVHGSDSCPSCKAVYQWEIKRRRDVPYPEGVAQKVFFVTRHFVLPLLFKRLLVLLALYALEWFLLPVVVGFTFYGQLSGTQWLGPRSWFRCLEVWLLGTIFLVFSQAIFDCWKGWRRFFFGHYNHTTEQLAPLPIDSLDEVYYDAAAAAAAERARKERQRGGGSGAKADQGEDVSATVPPVLYQDMDPERERNAANTNGVAEVDDEFSSETDLSAESASNAEDDGEEDGDWEDTESSTDNDEPEQQQQPGEPDDAAPNGDGRRHGEGVANRAGNNSGVAVSSGFVASFFEFLDRKKERRGRRRRLRKLFTHRLALAGLAAFLLRSAVGVALVVAGLMAAAVVVRRRFPRLSLRNSRRRFDEMVANSLQHPGQVTPAQRRIWFMSFLTQMFLFSFIMPVMGGVVIHYATAPFVVPFPSSFAAFWSTLNVVRVVLYWCMGTVSGLVLMTVECNVIVPLFAPGVDLFFIRAIDLHFELEQLYYELILAQLYDTDPLGVMCDFLIIAPIELLALLVFISLPVWTSMGLREALFADVSSGRIDLPIPLLAMEKAHDAARLPFDAPYSLWVQHQMLHELDHAVRITEVGGLVFLRNATPSTITAGVRLEPPPHDGDGGSDGNSDGQRMDAVDEDAGMHGTARALEGEAGVVALMAGVAALENDTESFHTLLQHATHLARVESALPSASPQRLWWHILSTFSSWSHLRQSVKVWWTIVRVTGRAGGQCKATLLLAARDVNAMVPFVDGDGSIGFDVAVGSLASSPSSTLRRASTWTPWKAEALRYALDSSQLSAGTAEDRCDAEETTARVLSPPASGDAAEEEEEALFALLVNASRYDAHPACLSTLLEVVLRRLPKVHRAADALAAVPLRFPFWVLLDMDSGAVILTLTAVMCLFRFPMQRVQLRVLRPVCHFLAKHVVDLEWFLFDTDRDKLLVGHLTNGERDTRIDMPQLPTQHLILRRSRYFRPDDLPANLYLRVALFAFLFLVVGTLLFWGAPILIFTVILGVGNVPALFAASASVCAVFSFSDPKLFVMCCSMAIVMPVGGLVLLMANTFSVLYELSLMNVVEDTWNYISEAEKVLVPFAE